MTANETTHIVNPTAPGITLGRSKITRGLIYSYVTSLVLCIVTILALGPLNLDSTAQVIVHSSIGTIGVLCGLVSIVLALIWIVIPLVASKSSSTSSSWGSRIGNALVRLLISFVAGYVLFLPLVFAALAASHSSPV